MVDITRRVFLKAAGMAAAAASLGIRLEAHAFDGALKTAGAKETLSVCCYCAVGCGLIIHTVRGRVVNVEGNPDCPINRGALCAKGSSLRQLITGDGRATKPLYRAPGATDWREITWEKALSDIARKIKTTRDAYFQETNGKGTTVNRVEAIASVGSAALDNEECYLYQKMLRGLGVVYIEHQARV